MRVLAEGLVVSDTNSTNLDDGTLGLDFPESGTYALMYISSKYIQSMLLIFHENVPQTSTVSFSGIPTMRHIEGGTLQSPRHRLLICKHPLRARLHVLLPGLSDGWECVHQGEEAVTHLSSDVNVEALMLTDNQIL